MSRRRYVALADATVHGPCLTRPVGWAVAKLKAEYFDRDPDEILDVWLFKDRESYERNAKLTIDAQLHRSLSEQLPAACAAVAGATACSVLFADPTSGQILAFSEWERTPRAPGPPAPRCGPMKRGCSSRCRTSRRRA